MWRVHISCWVWCRACTAGERQRFDGVTYLVLCIVLYVRTMERLSPFCLPSLMFLASVRDPFVISVPCPGMGHSDRMPQSTCSHKRASGLTPHTLVVMWVVNLSLTGYTTAGHTPQPLDGHLFLCLYAGGIFCVLGQFLLLTEKDKYALFGCEQSFPELPCSHATCVSCQLCLSKMSCFCTKKWRGINEYIPNKHTISLTQGRNEGRFWRKDRAVLWNDRHWPLFLWWSFLGFEYLICPILIW